MLLFRRRDDHRRHLGMADHLLVAAARNLRAGRLGERASARRIAIRDCEEADSRMLGGKPRAQGPDAAGADHGKADIGLFHAYATCRIGTSRR